MDPHTEKVKREYRDSLNKKLSNFVSAYQTEADKYIQDVVGGAEKLNKSFAKKCKVISMKAAYQAEPEIERLRQIWLKLHPKEKKKELDFATSIGMKAHIGIVRFWSELHNNSGYTAKKESTMSTRADITNESGNEKENGKENSKSSSFTSIYEDLAQNYDLLPPDAMMAKLCSVAVNTPSGTRYYLKDKGYDFVLVPMGNTNYWKVSKRPATKETMLKDITSAISDWSKDDLEVLIDLVKKNKK